MIKYFKKIIKKTKVSKLMRFIIRNHRFRWVAALTIFIIILVTIISLIEQSENQKFESIFDVFYFAIVTISTVGYGDITPEYIISKILAIFLIISGVLLTSFMTATFASIFTATRIREGMGLKKIDLEKHIVICGFNSNLESVIEGIICFSGKIIPDIILINSLPESEIAGIIEHFPGAPLHYVYGDYTSEATLQRASISKVSSAIILADSGSDGNEKPDDRTLIATLAIKSMSKETEVCAELLDAKSIPHLRRAGVDQIILSGEFSGFLLANAVLSPGIPQALREMINIQGGADIQRRIIPHEFIGKTFKNLAMEFIDNYGYITFGIITEKKSFNMENILAGESSAIDAFIRRKFDEAGRSLEIESKGRLTVKINPGKDYIISEDDYAIILTPKKEEA
ncbi:ion channel [Candidatus Latescibacterota bacterium]